MLFGSKPSRSSIDAFLLAQKLQDFSYRDVGASRSQAPSGYTTDHNRIRLGRGAEIYKRAQNAIWQWKIFEMRWVNLCWPATPLEAGATVAVLVSHFGFWSL